MKALTVTPVSNAPSNSADFEALLKETADAVQAEGLANCCATFATLAQENEIMEIPFDRQPMYMAFAGPFQQAAATQFYNFKNSKHGSCEVALGSPVDMLFDMLGKVISPERLGKIRTYL